MPNQNLTSEQTQFIMNRVKHTGIDALDIIPYSLSADGTTATPVSSAAPLPTKITDGTDTATVATALDSRNGLDTQASSIASKNIVDFVSTSGALSSGGAKIFSPGGTRATYYDLDGYEGLYFSFTDNSPGASGGTMYFRWSRDGSNTAYNDPNDGTGFTNYDGVSTAPLVGATFIPKKNRYVNFVFIQGGANQGSTYPQLALMDITAYPYGFFTSAISITNSVLPVVGPTDAATYGLQPVITGGVDSVSAPTTSIPILVSSTGQAAVQGTATAYNGTPLVTVERLGTTGTLVNTSVATASTQVAASSTTRRGFAIHNDSSQPCLLKFGTSASTTSYTVAIQPNENWQMPLPLYSGAITCISAIADAGGVWRTTTW